MYDQLFSLPWFFDRCQNLASFPLTLILLFLMPLAGSIILFYFLNKINRKMTINLLYTFISLPIFFVLNFAIVMMIGYGLVDCTASSRYWPLIEPAKQLNAELNHLYVYKLPMPKNEQELEQMFPEKFRDTTEFNKLIYKNKCT